MTRLARRTLTLLIAATSMIGACKKNAPDARGTAGGGGEQTRATTAPAGGSDAIALSAMRLVGDEAAGNGFCIPASLAADGTITAEDRPAGRFAGNRLLTPDGAEVFRVEGAQLIVPWNTSKNLRIEANGAFVDARGDRFDVSATGVPSMRGENGRCRVEGYSAAQRRTALLLFVAPMMLMARGMAATNGLLNVNGEDAGAPAAAPRGIAQFRVIHAASRPAAAHVTFKWNAVETPAFADIAYGTRTGHYATQTGSPLYSVFPLGNLDREARLLAGSTPELEANKDYTAVFADVVLGGQPTLVLVIEPDGAPPAPSADSSLVSFFNAWTGSDSIDVCVAAPRGPATTIFESSVEGVWATPRGENTNGSFVTIPTASLARIQLRARADRSCTGRVLGNAAVPELASNRQYMLVATGQRAGRPSGQLIACPTDTGECRTVPIGR